MTFALEMRVEELLAGRYFRICPVLLLRLCYTVLLCNDGDDTHSVCPVVFYSIHSVGHNSRSFTFWWGKTFTGKRSYLFVPVKTLCCYSPHHTETLTLSKSGNTAKWGSLYSDCNNVIKLKSRFNSCLCLCCFCRQSPTLILVYIINKGKFLCVCTCLCFASWTPNKCMFV